MSKGSKSIKKKVVLEDISIEEISQVDRPAQQPALARIMKRDSKDTIGMMIAKRYIDPADGAVSFSTVLQEKLKSKQYSESMEEFWPIIYALQCSLESIAGDPSISSETKMSMMSNSVDNFLTVMRSKLPEFEEMMKKVLADLGFSAEGDENMSKKVEKNENDEPTVDDLKNQITDLTKKLEAATAASKDVAKAAELQAQLDELQKKFEASEVEKAEAIAKASMNDAEKAFFETLKGKDREEFMKMDSKDRSKAIQKKEEADETIQVEGRTVRKSVVGEDQFAIFKSMADRLEKAEKANREEREARQRVVFEKRASEEFDKLPGKLDEHVEVLKAIESMPEKAKETLGAMLKAGNAAMKSAFIKIGHRDGTISDDVKKGAENFKKRVSEIMSAEKCSHTAAMQKARKTYPEEFDAYQEAQQASE